MRGWAGRLWEDAEWGVTTLRPYLRVLPMGWNWALHIAHSITQEAVRRALPTTPFVRDREFSPCLKESGVAVAV